MGISVSIMAILAFFAMFDNSKKNNETGIGLLAFFVGIVELFSFFRTTQNLNFQYSDLIIYYGYFQTMPMWDWSTFQTTHPFEFGYDLIVYVLAKISTAYGVQISAHDFVLTFTALTIFVLYIAARIHTNRSSAVFISLLYLWYQYSNLFNYNIVRQGVALSFLILSMSLYAKYKRKLLACSIMIIAVFFHKSIIYLGILPLLIVIYKDIRDSYIPQELNQGVEKRKLISGKMLIVCGIGIFLYITHLNILFGKLPIGIVQIYQSESVASTANELGTIENSIHFLLIALIYLVILSLFWYFNENKIRELTIFYDFFFFGTVLYLFMGFIPFSFRIEFAALYILPFIVGLILYKAKMKNYFILLLIFIVVMGYKTGPFYLLK